MKSEVKESWSCESILYGARCKIIPFLNWPPKHYSGNWSSVTHAGAWDCSTARTTLAVGLAAPTTLRYMTLNVKLCLIIFTCSFWHLQNLDITLLRREPLNLTHCIRKMVYVLVMLFLILKSNDFKEFIKRSATYISSLYDN